MHVIKADNASHLRINLDEMFSLNFKVNSYLLFKIIVETFNNLIKNGATLVTNARDVLDALAPLTRKPISSLPSMEEPPRNDLDRPEASESDRRRIVDALGPTPVAVDELIAFTGASPAQVYLVLLELDLAGRLQRHSGGTVSLVYL